MATPVIVDLNNDAHLEELVIPVSYFFDPEEYRFVNTRTHQLLHLVGFIEILTKFGMCDP